MDLLTTYTRLGTTSNYSTIAELHNSQITTAPAKPFPACYAFTSRSLATASNSGDSSASRAHILSLQPPVQNSTVLVISGMDHTKTRLKTGANGVSVTSRNNPLLGNGSVSMFLLQRLHTERQNNRGTVRHGDLYSVRPEVIKELVQFIRR
jgi:hypothetical protein